MLIYYRHNITFFTIIFYSKFYLASVLILFRLNNNASYLLLVGSCVVSLQVVIIVNIIN